MIIFVVVWFDRYKKSLCIRFFRKYGKARIFIRLHKLKNYKLKRERLTKYESNFYLWSDYINKMKRNEL